MFAISYTQLDRLSFLNVFNLVNVARRNDVIPRSYAKTLSIYQLSLTLCTPTLSVTLQFHVFFFLCETYERKPGLHPGNCFGIYPTLKN